MAAKNLKEAVKEDLKENEEKIVRLSEDDVEEFVEDFNDDFVDEKENIFKKSLNWSKKHWKGLAAGAAGLALVIGTIALGKTSDEDDNFDDEDDDYPAITFNEAETDNDSKKDSDE